MDRTADMNEFLTERLNNMGFVVKNEAEFTSLKIERDSMCCFWREAEDTSYSKTLKTIRNLIPSDYYAHWSMKDDDFYYLEIVK